MVDGGSEANHLLSTMHHPRQLMSMQPKRVKDGGEGAVGPVHRGRAAVKATKNHPQDALRVAVRMMVDSAIKSPRRLPQKGQRRYSITLFLSKRLHVMYRSRAFGLNRFRILDFGFWIALNCNP